MLATGMALLVPSIARAWSASGHMVVAQIAADAVSPVVRTRAERLLALIRLDSLPVASLWMDDARGRGFRHFDRWHYVNLPYAVEGQTPLEPPEVNVIWAIEKTRGALQEPQRPALRRALDLAVLLHLVGDIHQPMHGVGRISPDHPRGDRGGNDFPLTGPVSNLHALWDRCAGLLPALDPEAPGTAAAVQDLAAALTARHPRSTMPNVDVRRPRVWAEESRAMAIDYAYAGLEPATTPSDAYLARAQQVIGPRLALAGYRLADLLEHLFQPAP